MIEPKQQLKSLVRTSTPEPSRMFKHRLDRNERNQPFSDKFIEHIKSQVTGELFMVYPELEGVYEKIAQWLSLSVDQIMLHSGSEQAIKSVFETFISPGDRIMLHAPGFAMYNVYSNMFQAEVIQQQFDSDLVFDWEGFAQKITPALRMVVIENPNGFLGIAPPVEAMKRIIAKACNFGTIALVDEAYYHFHEITVADWLGEFDNLIVTRTFSKAFGLAGLRAGYLISNPDNMSSLKKVRPSYEINSFTALVVLELLKNYAEVQQYLEDSRENLRALRLGLGRLGIAASDSKANFVAVRLGGEERYSELRLALREKDILIRRPFREPALREWVRISTAPPQVQEALLEEIRTFLNRN